MWHWGPKPVTCRFWLFYLLIFYTASASKYFLQNENILLLTEVILVWLEQSKQVKKSIKKFMIFCVIIILCNHYFIILKIFQAIKFFILNKTNGIKIGLQLHKLWQIHGHQLNLRIANSKSPLLFGPLATSDGFWALLASHMINV